ncbi:MAG: hypothetical protein ACRC7N_13690 [Clostridium sp.]
MSPYEIALLIKDDCGGNMTETIESLNDLIESIENNPEWVINELIEAKETIAEINNCCPKCGDSVQYIKDGEEISEYFGREVGETIGAVVCENYKCMYTTRE